jgi:hypothetical protein
MSVERGELDRLQGEYRAAVDAWRETIGHEEALATGVHEAAELDRWEEAHFAEEAARTRAKSAKAAYQDALRRAIFHF